MTTPNDDTTPLMCPKCEGAMRPLETPEGVTVDRCEKCFGIWLDRGERTRLLANKSTIRGLDIGDADLGEKQDQITEINCPRDGSPMRHVTHPDQRHIGFEQCDACGGSFFDAGELQDLSHLSLGDFFRNFLRVR